MKLDDIYTWLMETDPVKDNAQIRLVWANMASYCYFVNILDFDSEYKDRLIQVLKKSKVFGVTVPDDNHQKVLDIAKNMNSEQGDKNIKALLYG